MTIRALLAVACVLVGLASPAIAAGETRLDAGFSGRPEPGQVAAPPDTVGPESASRELGLDEAVRMAMHSSPELQVEETRVDAAYGRQREAWGGFLPNVGVGYAYANSSTGRIDPTGQEITNTSWSTQLTARYDVFSGFSRFTGLRAARRSTAAAEARYAEARERVTFEVKAAWFEAVAAIEVVEAERRRVTRQETQLDSVEVQLELGRVARPELLRARAAVNEARLALIRARATARETEFILARVVGLDEPATPRREDVSDPAPLPLDFSGAWQAALRHGPGLQGADAEAEAARADARRANSRYFPSLAVEGGWAWNSPHFPPERQSWRIQVFGSVPLFDGFSREARVDEAKATATAAEAGARLERLRLREGLMGALALIEGALEGVRLSEETVELSREELEMQRERFRLGRGSLLEVQEAEAGLARAEADRVRARLDYHRGRAQLEFLMGIGIEEAADDHGSSGGAGDSIGAREGS